MDSATPLSMLTSILPFLIMVIILLSIAVPISLRKGRNPFLWGLLCFIPFVNLYLVIWLASQTDLEVKNQIKSLQDDLAKIRFSLDNKTN